MNKNVAGFLCYNCIHIYLQSAKFFCVLRRMLSVFCTGVPRIHQLQKLDEIQFFYSLYNLLNL